MQPQQLDALSAPLTELQLDQIRAISQYKDLVLLRIESMDAEQGSQLELRHLSNIVEWPEHFVRCCRGDSTRVDAIINQLVEFFGSSLMQLTRMRHEAEIRLGNVCDDYFRGRELEERVFLELRASQEVKSSNFEQVYRFDIAALDSFLNWLRPSPSERQDQLSKRLRLIFEQYRDVLDRRMATVREQGSESHSGTLQRLSNWLNCPESFTQSRQHFDYIEGAVDRLEMLLEAHAEQPLAEQLKLKLMSQMRLMNQRYGAFIQKRIETRASNSEALQKLHSMLNQMESPESFLLRCGANVERTQALLDRVESTLEMLLTDDLPSNIRRVRVESRAKLSQLYRTIPTGDLYVDLLIERYPHPEQLETHVFHRSRRSSSSSAELFYYERYMSNLHIVLTGRWNDSLSRPVAVSEREI